MEVTSVNENLVKTVRDGVVQTLVNTTQDESIENVVAVKPEMKWDIIPNNGYCNKIRILNDNLRSFLYIDLTSSVISSAHVFPAESGDTNEKFTKIIRSRCNYPVLSFKDELERFSEVTKESVEGAGVSWELWEEFLQVLNTEISMYESRIHTILESGVTRFDYLTYLLKKDEIYCFIINGKPLAMKVKSVVHKQSFFGSYAQVTGSIHVNMGKGLFETNFITNIGQYEGERSLKDLGITVLSTDSDLVKTLIERGKKYVQITSAPAYMQYSGQVTRRSYWYTNIFRAQGRVMVDVSGMQNIDTDYDKYFANHDNYESNREYLSSEYLTDDVYLTLPSIVYGFSFAAKVWGEIDLDKLESINFRSDAFDKLVLDEDKKDLIFSLVDTEFTDNADLIDGKGGGCIFLLEGSPGVGKTLTAEAVSEKLQRPLYMVGVGELGTDVSSLEETLRKILDIAKTWNAVLLLDEADIFLRARDGSDLERNAMVGVFLRLLEYYPGILFLTTNLAGNLDRAFFSRISLALHYADLTGQSRKAVWDNLLESHGIEGMDTLSLSAHDLNGRQIKNIIRNGCALAKKAGRAVSIEDFNRVIGTVVEFQEKLTKNSN